MQLAKKISFFGIGLDLALIAVRLLDTTLRTWIIDNHLLIFWLIGLLQIACIWACFRAEGVAGLHQFSEQSSIGRFLNGMQGLLLVLSLGAFLWLFVPGGAFDAWSALTFNFFVVVFGSMFALGFALENKDEPLPPLFNLSSTLIVFCYLSASEALISVSSTDYNVPLGVVVLCCLMSYVPFRTILLLREPFSLLEAASALTVLIVFFVGLI